MSAPERDPRFLSFPEVCERLNISTKTPQNWAAKGYVQPYQTADGTLVLNIEEVEAALKLYGPSKMRDGRKRYGANIKPMPVRVEVAENPAEASE